MSTPLTLGVVFVATLTAFLLVIGGIAIAGLIEDRRKRRRRRRRIDEEGSDAIEAWGVQIPMIFPEAAPRNGTPFSDEKDPPTNR